MKISLVKVFILCLSLSAVFAQIWDLGLFPDDEFDEESLLDDDDDENTTSILKLVHLNSADLQNEKELLEESSDIIIDEVSALMGNDLDDKSSSQLNEIISEHTVQLFNVISQIKFESEESSIEKKLSFNDIFIWSNESDDKIKDILDDYYRDS